jgi:Na+/phosphate symporter
MIIDALGYLVPRIIVWAVLWFLLGITTHWTALVCALVALGVVVFGVVVWSDDSGSGSGGDFLGDLFS